MSEVLRTRKDESKKGGNTDKELLHWLRDSRVSEIEKALTHKKKEKRKKGRKMGLPFLDHPLIVSRAFTYASSLLSESLEKANQSVDLVSLAVVTERGTTFII